MNIPTLTGCPLAFLSTTVTRTSTSTPSNTTRWGVSQKAALLGVSKASIAAAICGRISSRAADWAHGFRHRDLGKVDLRLHGQPFFNRVLARLLAITSDPIRGHHADQQDQRHKREQQNHTAPTHSEQPSFFENGRGTRVRTRDLRFWRPSLYQLSYTPTARRNTRWRGWVQEGFMGMGRLRGKKVSA